MIKHSRRKSNTSQVSSRIAAVDALIGEDGGCPALAFENDLLMPWLVSFRIDVKDGQLAQIEYDHRRARRHQSSTAETRLAPDNLSRLHIRAHQLGGAVSCSME